MNKELLIEYLYGEMNEQEKHRFEERLEQEPELKKELSELKMVRNFLQKNDAQTSDPVQLVINKSPKTGMSRWWAIAASLLILLVAGRLLNLRITTSGNEMTLSYGSPIENENENVAQLPQALESEFVHLEKKLSGLENQVASIASLTQNKNPESTEVSQNSVDKVFLTRLINQALNNYHNGLENQMVNKILEEQQSQLHNATEDLRIYLDEQRSRDLDLINQGLLRFAQSLQLNNDDDYAQFVSNPYKNY